MRSERSAVVSVELFDYELVAPELLRQRRSWDVSRELGVGREKL
jgi:hypothetical protein